MEKLHAGTIPDEVSVVSVRRISLKKPVPVYDATVPKYHNFALDCGVYVHNTAKDARFPYQAILPLKGKILNCVSGDTLVRVTDGPARPISELTTDWIGVGFNVETQGPSPDRISASFVTKHVTELLVLEFDDGSVLKCTPDHLILTDRGYVSASELREDDVLVTVTV